VKPEWKRIGCTDDRVLHRNEGAVVRKGPGAGGAGLRQLLPALMWGRVVGWG
jgi:hypothetical protein